MRTNYPSIAGLFMISGLTLGAAVLLSQASSGESATAVSPGSLTEVIEVAGSCPTFSWSGVTDARGYEVVVYRLTEAGTLESVLQIRVPGRAAASWTPGTAQCLDSGARYAWAVRGVSEGGPGSWSDLLQFETAGLPSADEVRQALEVLRRYRGRVGDVGEGLAPSRGGRGASDGSDASDRLGIQQPTTHNQQPAGRGPLTSPTAAAAPSPQGVSTPASFSLNLDGDLSLGGSLFKDGYPLLHNDQSPSHYNTAVGFNALPATTPGSPGGANGVRNTAVGHEALELNTEGFRNTATGFKALASNVGGHRNTADGHLALFSNTIGFRNTALGNRALYANQDGYANTAVGDRAMQLNESGYDNTAIGYRALHSNTSGYRNTAVGAEALQANTNYPANTAIGFRALFAETGFGNTAVGYRASESSTGGVSNTALGLYAGSNWTGGRNNIAIGASVTGLAGDDYVIRIGTEASGPFTDTTTYIAGIAAHPVTGSSVLVTASGQLGVQGSSARFKHDIRDLEAVGERLHRLRPVSFRYRDERVDGTRKDRDTFLEYGLIAEEVARVFPELVSYDELGRPFTVRYHLLTPLLLAEIQRQELELRDRDAAFAELGDQVVELRRRLERLAKKKRLR